MLDIIKYQDHIWSELCSCSEKENEHTSKCLLFNHRQEDSLTGVFYFSWGVKIVLELDSLTRKVPLALLA